MSNANKIMIDVFLVKRLISEQFPQWANLSIKPVEFSGWDNRTFHLGDYMSVRLPSAAPYAEKVLIEQYWLPKLAPFLPQPIPIPLAMGKPADGYPWQWSIYKWLDGQTASLERINNLAQFATSLGDFLCALQRIDANGGPLAGAHNFYRGGPLATYDAETRQAIMLLTDQVDVAAVTDVWNTALASTWQNPPVWVHGDVAIGNLLVVNGQLNAVIDFGCMGVGDPACDLVLAWTFFKGGSRDAFRAALPLDKNTWARARGWALWKALCWAFPGEKRIDWRVVNEVLADHKIEK